MSLDWKKLKKTLERNHITPLEFFCLDNECALIKTFLNKNAEFMFLYISSKYRFSVKNENVDGKPVYSIEEDESETGDSDDYSKSGKVPDMENIEVDKSINSYKELTRKYQKTISLEGSEEPIPRKMKRQVERLKIPFNRLSYDISLQIGKWICLSFGDSISMFTIKGYNATSSRQRTFLYLINLSDLVEKVEDLQEEVAIIKEQFYDIVNRVSVSNMESISTEIDQYPKVMTSIEKKKTDYNKSIVDYQALYQETVDKEERFVKQYKEKLDKEQGLKRSSIEFELQRHLDVIYNTRKELVQKGVELLQSYQRNLFVLEEVSFDNSIMVTRVKKNFNLLKETF